MLKVGNVCRVTKCIVDVDDTNYVVECVSGTGNTKSVNGGGGNTISSCTAQSDE